MTSCFCGRHTSYAQTALLSASESPGQAGPALLQARLSRILKAMEVHFTPEQEAQLAQVAANAGTDAERLVKDAASRLLEQDARFRAAVREGIAQADRGEFVEEEQMTGNSGGKLWGETLGRETLGRETLGQTARFTRGRRVAVASCAASPVF
jgi:predicted transcriptional regulator